MTDEVLFISIGECTNSLDAWRWFRDESARLARAGDQRVWSLDLDDESAAVQGPFLPGPPSGPLGRFDEHLSGAIGLLQFTVAEVERADSPADVLRSPTLLTLRRALLRSVGDANLSASPLRATGNRIVDRDMLRRFGAICEPYTGVPVGGVLRGPDGRTYVVAANGEPEGWRVVGVSEQSTVMPPGELLSDRDRGAVRLGGLVGAPYVLHGWQSLGSDQQRYLTALPDGSIEVSDGTGPPRSFERPPDDPTMHERVETPAPASPNRRGERVDNAMSLLDFGIAAAETELTIRQTDANASYLSQVVFEENETGVRRATINLYQVQTDGENVRVARYYGRINEAGELERVPSSELTSRPPEAPAVSTR